MTRKAEKNNIKSCWNKAGENELMFILLARDLVAPRVIRFWAAERIAEGKNISEDLQIQEALAIARRMELQNDSCNETTD